jgi:hypothetical protein
MQPAVRLDDPFRRPLGALRIVNHGPVNQPRVIESLVEEDAFFASDAEKK